MVVDLGVVFVVASVLVFVVGLILFTVGNMGVRDLGLLVLILGVMLCLVVFLTLPISRLEAQASMREVEAVRETAEQARSVEGRDRLEVAAWRSKAAEVNTWIERARYYNEVFDWWWPDEVEDVEKIKIHPRK